MLVLQVNACPVINHNYILSGIFTDCMPTESFGSPVDLVVLMPIPGLTD